VRSHNAADVWQNFVPGRLSGRLGPVVDRGRPVNHDGRTQVLRSGETGKDAGLAALGQGWPIAATRGAMPAFGHTEPKRGAEWWGKKRLVTWRFSK